MNFKIKILTTVFITLLFLPVTAINPAGGYGQTSVKKWADDRKSAFTFTFDDGLICDYYYVMPILDSFGFKGTFFIITDSLSEDLPGISRFGTWNQFRAMSLDGHEIASHSVTHPDFLDLITGNITTPGTLLFELYQSKYTIEQKIPNQKCITIAYPYFDYNTNVLNKTPLYYESARTSDGYPIGSSLTGSGFYTIGGYEENFTTPRNSTLDDLDELENFEYYQQIAITDGTWGMLVAHEVVPFPQLADLLLQDFWYPMSTEWFTSLCQWLKQKSNDNDVWIETMGNVTRYMKEREHFSYSITSQTATRIQINVTDNLTNTIYNYPLTIDITVPPDWKAAIVIQGSRTDTINTFISGTNTLVRTHVIPDGGTLILNKTNLVPVLTLTALIQGLYNGDTMVSDTITVELHNASSPYTIVDSRKGVLNNAGVGAFNLPNSVDGIDYYLVIKHRNSIETWSGATHSFTSGSLSYDFTTSQNQAYGSNLIQKGAKWCIYSGDVNQDGLIDMSDLIAVDNDNAIYFGGNVKTDVNGDGIVDLNDLVLVHNNNMNYISKVVPP